MHELGITQSILETVVEAAKEQGGTRINEVTLSVGELTEVQDFALQFNWDIITQGSIAEGATLTVKMIKPRSKCLQCGAEYEHHKLDHTCPECGNVFVENTSGHQLQIDSIDIDTDGDHPAGDAEADDAGSAGPVEEA